MQNERSITAADSIPGETSWVELGEAIRRLAAKLMEELCEDGPAADAAALWLGGSVVPDDVSRN